MSQKILNIYKNEVYFKLLIKIIAFVNSIITVHVLGLDGFGALAFLYMMPPFFKMIVNKGYSEGLNRWLPELGQESSSYLNFVLIKNFVFSSLIVLILANFGNEILEFFKLGHRSSFVILCVATIVFFESVTVPLECALWCDLENKFFNKVELSSNLISIISFYLLYGTNSLTIDNLVLIVAVLSVIRSITVVYKFLKRDRKHLWKISIPKDKKFHIYSLNFFINSLLGHLISNKGISYYIQYHLGVDLFALFKLVEKVWENLLAIGIPGSFRRAINVKVYECKELSGPEIRSLVLGFYKKLNLIGFIICTLFLVLTPFFLKYLYRLEVDSEHFIIVAFYGICSYINLNGSLFGLPILYFKKPHFYLISKVALSVTAVVLYPFFIKYYKLEGAIISYFLILNIEFIFFIIISKKLTNLSWINLNKVFTFTLSAFLIGLSYAKQSYVISFVCSLGHIFICIFYILSKDEKERIFNEVINSRIVKTIHKRSIN